MSKKNPAITVLMSVYNAQDSLDWCIECILAQSFKDFEFLIINDGSKDDSLKILEDYAQRDSRITLVTQENRGLTKSLNKGLELAKGDLIARQDADDFSMPKRLEIQYNYFKQHPEIDLLGSDSIDDYKDYQGRWGSYTEDELNKIVMSRTPFPHSTAMYRKNAVLDLGGYDEEFKTSQDMDLWIRFAKRSPIAMIDEALIIRTVGENSISAKKKKQQFKDALAIRLKHSPQCKLYMLYISLRSLLIAYLPAWIIKLRQKLKS